MRYSVEEVASMMGAQCYGECRGNVSFLLTDSRSLCFPEETLFFALRSARNDGQQAHWRELRCPDTKRANRQRQQRIVNFHALSPPLRVITRYSLKWRKHDSNHKKMKITKRENTFAILLTNRKEMRGRTRSLERKSVQRGSQTHGYDQTEDDNRCYQ